MKKLLFFLLACCFLAGIAVIPGISGQPAAYKINAGDARWHTKLNAGMDALWDYVTGFATTISNWAIEDQIVTMIPVTCTYSDADTFTLAGDYTSRFAAGAVVHVHVAAGMVYSTVASSSYAAPTTTVNLSDAVLTDPVSYVYVVATRDGLWPNGPGYVVAADYGTDQAALIAANAVAAAAGKQLVIGRTYSITSTPASPLTANLKVMPGAVISIATGATLTINGSLDAGLYQIFSSTGTGKVVFGQGSVEGIWPQWWGAKADWNGTAGTDDAASLQAAFDCAGASTVNLGLIGRYKITTEILPTQNIWGITIQGYASGTDTGGAYAAEIVYTGSDAAAAALRVAGTEFGRNVINSVKFDGGNGGGWGVKFDVVATAATTGWNKSENAWNNCLFFRGKVATFQVGNATCAVDGGGLPVGDLNADGQVFNTCAFIVSTGSIAPRAVLTGFNTNECRYTFNDCQFGNWSDPACPATLLNYVEAISGVPVMFNNCFFARNDNIPIAAPGGYAIYSRGAHVIVRGGVSEDARLFYRTDAAVGVNSDNHCSTITDFYINDIRTDNDDIACVVAYHGYTHLQDCVFTSDATHYRKVQIDTGLPLFASNVLIGSDLSITTGNYSIANWVLSSPDLALIDGRRWGDVPNWTTPAFAGTDFTSNVGTWVVGAADVVTFKYRKVDHQLTVNFKIITTTVTGTPAILKIKIPYVSTSAMILPCGYYENTGNDYVPCYAQVAAGSDIISIRKVTGNWAAATDTTELYGSITFEVQ